MFTNLLRISLFTLSIASLGVLFDSSSANAQINYNDAFELIDKNEIVLSKGNSTEDIYDVDPLHWSSLFTQDQIPDYLVNQGITSINDIQCDFNPSTATQWFVYSTYTGPHGSNQRTVMLRYTEETNAYIDFRQDVYGIEGREYSDWNMCQALINPNGSYLVRENKNSSRISGSQGETIYVILAYADLRYPSNYTGVIPPDSIDTPQSPIGVSIRGSVAEDVVQVEWYNDSKNPAPEEAKGMYLVLHNTNIDEDPPECSNTGIQEWRHSLDEIAIFNPVSCYGFYFVQSYYTYDAAGQDIIPDTDLTVLNMRIDGGSFYFDYVDVEYDEDGYIISPPLAGISMSDCITFTQDIPWFEIEFKGCFENVQKFIGIAKENNIQMSRQFNAVTMPAHSSCGSFTKIDEFLYVSEEDNWVCPQLTEKLRMPITYFAVFLLYIITVFGWFRLASKGS